MQWQEEKSRTGEPNKDNKFGVGCLDLSMAFLRQVSWTCDAITDISIADTN
jgi:hypothetical protein